MKAGPKRAVDGSPLPFHSPLTGSRRLEAFCGQYITVPKGKGARGRLTLRPWQLELVSSVWDASPRPRLAGWMLPRGQGKTTLVAALGLYELLLGEEGASVVVAATDERQASLAFAAAARMVELDPRLEARVQAYAQRLHVPARGASFQVLPAVAKRLEGLDPTLAILDEIGFVDRAVYEVVAHASGKRAASLVLGIGTPPPDVSDSVLADMRAYAAEHPEDASFVWREHSAAGFRDHPVGCRHCWAVANPALGDFLYEDALAALLPPKTREGSFRRARLCQFIEEADDPWLPPGAWGACQQPRGLEDGAEVVLGFDGSYNGDCTAIVACTVPAASGERPHLAVVELWEAPEGERHWLVPILEVEEAIRTACRRYKVAEVVCDPFRWARSMQVLEGEGLPILEYPQSPQRMTPATTRFYEAVVNGALSHDGDARLARHVGNAVLREDARGARIAKPDKHSKRRIDLAVAALMAHDRACQLAAADDDYDLMESVW